ncbi:MAG: alpha/beta fold hydrolase [Pseudomonadota bacterium]
MQIDATVGPLEARMDVRTTDTRAALLCHPHPQYGGSMHDAVLDCAAQRLSDAGFATLRFNFRGVGGSAGAFDNGVGEKVDVIDAWNWLRAQSNWDALWLVGYSFGAAMAWGAQRDCAGLDRLVLIAPPASAIALPAEAGDGAYDVIVGTEDGFFSAARLPPGARLQTLPGADHFFGGEFDALAAAVTTLL